MNSKERNDKKPLTLQETIELFGAEESVDLGPIRLDPLGMKFLATKVGERLKGGRGRPTDKSWTMVRKIPMKQETWNTLNEIAEHLEERSFHIAAGQVAAYVLERGVDNMREQTESAADDFDIDFHPPIFECSEEIQEEAKRLAPVVEEAIW